jgi:hypothetical protein
MSNPTIFHQNFPESLLQPLEPFFDLVYRTVKDLSQLRFGSFRVNLMQVAQISPIYLPLRFKLLLPVKV